MAFQQLMTSLEWSSSRQVRGVLTPRQFVDAVRAGKTRLPAIVRLNDVTGAGTGSSLSNLTNDGVSSDRDNYVTLVKRHRERKTGDLEQRCADSVTDNRPEFGTSSTMDDVILDPRVALVTSLRRRRRAAFIMADNRYLTISTETKYKFRLLSKSHAIDSSQHSLSLQDFLQLAVKDRQHHTDPIYVSMVTPDSRFSVLQFVGLYDATFMAGYYIATTCSIRTEMMINSPVCFPLHLPMVIDVAVGLHRQPDVEFRRLKQSLITMTVEAPSVVSVPTDGDRSFILSEILFIKPDIELSLAPSHVDQRSVPVRPPPRRKHTQSDSLVTPAWTVNRTSPLRKKTLSAPATSASEISWTQASSVNGPDGCPTGQQQKPQVNDKNPPQNLRIRSTSCGLPTSESTPTLGRARKNARSVDAQVKDSISHDRSTRENVASEYSASSTSQYAAAEATSFQKTITESHSTESIICSFLPQDSNRITIAGMSSSGSATSEVEGTDARSLTNSPRLVNKTISCVGSQSSTAQTDDTEPDLRRWSTNHSPMVKFIVRKADTVGPSNVDDKVITTSGADVETAGRQSCSPGRTSSSNSLLPVESNSESSSETRSDAAANCSVEQCVPNLVNLIRLFEDVSKPVTVSCSPPTSSTAVALPTLSTSTADTLTAIQIPPYPPDTDHQSALSTDTASAAVSTAGNPYLALIADDYVEPDAPLSPKQPPDSSTLTTSDDTEELPASRIRRTSSAGVAGGSLLSADSDSSNISRQRLHSSSMANIQRPLPRTPVEYGSTGSIEANGSWTQQLPKSRLQSVAKPIRKVFDYLKKQKLMVEKRTSNNCDTDSIGSTCSCSTCKVHNGKTSHVGTRTSSFSQNSCTDAPNEHLYESLVRFDVAKEASVSAKDKYVPTAIGNDLTVDCENFRLYEGETERVERRRSYQWSAAAEVPLDIVQLSVAEIVECLRLLKMSQYAEQFVDNDVDGSLLMTMDESLLQDSFGMTGLEAKKIFQFAKHGWRPKTAPDP